MTQSIDSYGDNPTHGFRGPGPGTLLGVYRLEEPLGRGGMGQVWKAWDTAGERVVAVKLLPPEFRGNKEAIAQVRDAFRVVHALTHQHIGKTIGMFDHEPHGPHVVLEYLPGVPLSKFARTHREEVGPLSVEMVAKLLRPVAEALDFAHVKGVLHRDVKPENILVEVQDGKVGDVWLIDFGLAAEIRSSLSRVSKGNVDTSGTLPYQSPEQLRGKRTLWDGRTDQYSLAVVAFELLAGHLPFEGEPFVLMHAIFNENAGNIQGVPVAANAAILRALAKNKAERFVTCVAFVRGLLAVLEAPIPQAPSVSDWAERDQHAEKVPAFPLQHRTEPALTIPMAPELSKVDVHPSHPHSDEHVVPESYVAFFCVYGSVAIGLIYVGYVLVVAIVITY